MSAVQTVWRVSGMHCPGCEAAVCRAAERAGLEKPSASFRRGELTGLWDPARLSEADLARAVAQAGYALAPGVSRRRSVLRAVGILLALAALFFLMGYTPLSSLFSSIPVARAGMSLGALFTLGLMTSLHCVAMCGGLNLGQSAASAQAGRRVTRANLQYNLGRLASYSATGALVGALGSAVRLSVRAQAAVQLFAALGMLLMALNLLDMPVLSRFAPSLPARWRGRLAGRNSSLCVGLLNGLMPCGPLQAMQLYALSAGSWYMGALSMLAFGLGTSPLMLGFGLIGGRLNRRFARPMRLFSGGLVLTMAVAMLTNGLALSGALPALSGPASPSQAAVSGGVQLVQSELDWQGYPDITVQSGMPVRWVIHAGEDKITGCNREMVIPALNLRVPLQPGDNVVEFTVDEPGIISYTCWMGMLRGSITVTE